MIENYLFSINFFLKAFCLSCPVKTLLALQFLSVTIQYKWIFIVVFLFLLYLVFYLIFKSASVYDEKFVQKNSSARVSKDQFRLYFLFLGITIPLLDLLVEFLGIRVRDTIFFNVLVGSGLLFIYFLSKVFSWVNNKIQIIFSLFFALYGVSVINDLIQFHDDLGAALEFVLMSFISYNVFKSLKYYWAFVFFAISVLIVLSANNLISTRLMILLINNCFLIAVLNYVNYIGYLNSKLNESFTDNIINKGTSLVIAVNLKGEVIYCSETITNILGYKPEEVKGLNFWNLTKDPEFTTINYEISPVLYTRKLQCKDGTFKHIQWKDSKYSDSIYVGIGQDVTKQIETQIQYQKLVELAADFIYETDRHGYFTFVNPFTLKLLDISKEEIIGMHYKSFIHPDHVHKVFEYYFILSRTQTEIPSIEFPIINRKGKTFWVSQKVTVTRNIEGKITGYITIARDITSYKQIEIEQLKRKNKLEQYDKEINNLIRKQYSKETFFEKLNYILKSTSIGSKIDRISYWSYSEENINCISLYELSSKEFSRDITINKEHRPIFFEAIQKDNVLVVSDVYETDIVKEFVDDYFIPNRIKSLLQVPVLVNGQMHSILRFELINDFNNWDTEDINFARSISEVIALALESEKRKIIDNELAKKTKILSAITACTEIILKSSDLYKSFEDIFSIIGKTTEVDRISYFRNDLLNSEMSIEYEWVSGHVKPQISNPLLKKMKHSDNDIFISKLSNKNIFKVNVSEIDDEKIKDRLINQQIETILIFPIFVKNHLYASIGFDDCRQGRDWTNDEIEVLQILANNLATAIERIENENLIHESEERFKLLANNIPGTVYLSNFDDNWSKIYLNDEIEVLTGYPKEYFLEQKINLIEIVHPDDVEDLINDTRKCIENRIPFHISYRIKRKSGEYIWVEEFGDTIIKNGKVEFVEGILFDITEKKQIDDQIKAREIAEVENKTKSEFLANMSHEIRTPLNAIIGFTDLLVNTNLDEEQYKFTSTVNQSADILLNLVNDILDFSKIETGKLEIEIHRTDIYELLYQITDILRFDATQKNINLNLNIDSKIPKNLFLDAFRLKQVLLNLVSNAVKFTNKGKVDISLNLVKKTEQFVSIIFSVEDTGIGIKKDNIDKIFEPFSQEDNSTTRKYGGTGLGLSISSNLLKLMDSKLQLSSNYRKGSNFYFELKVGYTNLEEEVKTAEVNEIVVVYEDMNSVRINKNINKTKVLIIEDNRINMMLSSTLLKKMIPDVIVIEAENGKIGIEKFTAESPDLILLDIQMPVLNGYETAVEIRKMNKEIPIIALTAGTIKGEKEKCIESGMNDYLSKPINKDIFENMLLKWL